MTEPVVGQLRLFSRHNATFPAYDFGAYWRQQGELLGCRFGEHAETQEDFGFGTCTRSVATVVEVLP
jgi:hypothetical protein